MLKFYYNPKYKYSNRTIIDVSGDGDYREIDYENIDSPDTINGHIIYTLNPLENIPTYIIENNTRRWFVSGITQLRTGKFQISLLRDIISESDLWKDEDAYISAGLATDMNRYKKWNLPFTNTKIKEERFNFAGNSSFFVFYANENKGNNGEIDEEDLHIYTSDASNITPDITVTNLNQIPNYDLFNNSLVFQNYFESVLNIKTGYIFPNIQSEILQASLNSSDYYNVGKIIETFPIIPTITIKTRAYNILNNVNNCSEDLKTAISNFTQNYLDDPDVIPYSTFKSLNSLNGKIVFNSNTNNYYRIKRISGNQNAQVFYFNSSTGATLISAIRNINFPIDAQSTDNNYSTDANFFRIESTRSTYTYTLEYLGNTLHFDFKFIADARKLPKSSVRCVNICAGNGFTNEDISQCLMKAQENYLNPDNTAGQIIDIQYLPFSLADSTDSNIQINSTSCIAKFLDYDDYEFYTDLTDLTDMNKETDTIKIVSPSRASQFLFSPYNNDGIMEFSTKITLRPFASVIYVRPSTKGLLLYDFDDKDCLIIQEDFSLTKVNSAWADYVRNNKNYSNIFERELQGREIERSWERKIEQAQARSDEWTARNISAEKAKTYTGNLPIISGISGAIATAVKDTAYMEAAQLDRSYNEAMYQESLSLSRDMFNMQLENIKAQPSIPSKITTIDCKLLDGIYLEYWSTNLTDKEAIKNYYIFNGNRIDAYGSFRTYYGWFVRGKIIRSVNYTQPEITELNRRLELGVFTEVEYAQ